MTLFRSISFVLIDHHIELLVNKNTENRSKIKIFSYSNWDQSNWAQLQITGNLNNQENEKTKKRGKPPNHIKSIFSEEGQRIFIIEAVPLMAAKNS